MKVYLAGPINDCTDAECKDWRQQAKELRHDIAWIDPMRRDYRGQEDKNVKAIVEDDKRDIEGCDKILAFCPKPSVGTSMEIIFGKYVKRAWPKCSVVVVVPPGSPVSPWLRYHADHLVETVEEGVALL